MKIMKSMILVVVLAIGMQGVGTERPLDKNLQKGFDAIQPMNPYNYCKEMASEKFSGRLTGHEGYTEAAQWAADYFKKWGLKPFNSQTGYLQPYPNPYVIVDQAEMTIFINERENATPLKLHEDFLPILYTDSVEYKAPVVFLGWGIHAPELGYDDYEGIEVKGKFALCFRGTPDPGNKKFEEHDHHRQRMKTAKEKGCVGLIYIYDEVQANPNGDWIQGFASAVISEKSADILLQEKGITAQQLRKSLSSDKKPRSFPLNAEVECRFKSRDFPDGVGYNVVGIIEGSDPVLKKEGIVIGGHFDHAGKQLGILFPGADDNASGSAVVMEIAHAFSRLKVKPKRSLVFALFGSEEQGLRGSYYLASHLPPLVSRVDSMFNFDMVGEGDGTVCVLNPDFPQLEQTVKEADIYVHTLRSTRYIQGVGVRSSDYAPFYLNGAVCVAFFSNGPHLHYHKPQDTIYRINPDIMADVARLAFLTAYKWADRL